MTVEGPKLTPTSSDHRREAIAHLGAAKRLRAELDALYKGPHDRVRAASLHDRIRHHLQVAKIEATLAASAPTSVRITRQAPSGVVTL